jgi:hypothetical protein
MTLYEVYDDSCTPHAPPAVASGALSQPIPMGQYFHSASGWPSMFGAYTM